jgi:alkylated DNA repair protein alkB family protein 6
LTNPVVPRISALGVFDKAPHGVNHCLINEYLPGQGIMPHEDGGAYFPVVATVSLGGTIVLDIVFKTGVEGDEAKVKRWRVLQEPRSLLLTTGAAYTDTLHGIAEVEQDEGLEAQSVANWSLLSGGAREAVEANGGVSERTTRISLTYRDVKKVSNVGSKIFGRFSERRGGSH